MGIFDIFFKSTSERINGIEFPKFEGNVHSKYKRAKSNYIRKNYYYKNYDEYKLQEYISKINSLGFNKVTEVRYENATKDYIIIDRNYKKWGKNRLHIGFHSLYK